MVSCFSFMLLNLVKCGTVFRKLHFCHSCRYKYLCNWKWNPSFCVETTFAALLFTFAYPHFLWNASGYLPSRNKNPHEKKFKILFFRGGWFHWRFYFAWKAITEKFTLIFRFLFINWILKKLCIPWLGILRYAENLSIFLLKKVCFFGEYFRFHFYV